MQEELELTFADTTPADWRLDAHTLVVGRQGIAKAREILESRDPMASAA